jgi:hypothetical protein
MFKEFDVGLAGDALDCNTDQKFNKGAPPGL